MMKYVLFLVAFCGFLLSCHNKQNDAGNSIETENVIAFSVSMPDGTPVKQASIQIRPLWYVEDTLESKGNSETVELVTNKDGYAQLDSLPDGVYRATVENDGYGFSQELDVRKNRIANSFYPMSLSPFGILHGTLDLPEHTKYGWVQIFGLNRIAKTDSLGNFQFENLPSGTYRIKAIVSDSLSALAEDLVQIRPEWTSEIKLNPSSSFFAEDLHTWPYHQELSLDSLISSWMEPIDYPVVLTVRLDSSNFPFDDALEDGRDIRFSDEDNQSLSFKKSYWNKSESKAVFHIRLPEFPATPILHMYWGKQGAQDISDTAIWDGISDSLFLEWNSILLDNFEDTSTQTSLLSPMPQREWYLRWSDTTVISDPTPSEGMSSAFQIIPDGREGRGLHITFTATKGKYVQFGTALGPGPRSFRAMDSLVYWIRGSGKYTFALDKLTGNTGKTVLEDTLPSQWTRIRLRPSDFDTADGIGGNAGWDAVCDSITNLTLFAFEGTEIWMDDIRFYGLNRDDLK